MKKEMKDNKKSVRPLGDRVLIKEYSEEALETKTKSGIIIPVTVENDRGTKRGEVIAVGPGRYEDGKNIPVSVKKGDEVLFSWGDKIKIDGVEYYIIRETEIIGVVE